jgi:hypothetical protein
LPLKGSHGQAVSSALSDWLASSLRLFGDEQKIPKNRQPKNSQRRNHQERSAADENGINQHLSDYRTSGRPEMSGTIMTVPPPPAPQKSRALMRAESIEIGHGPVRMRVTNIDKDRNLVEMRVDFENAEPPTKAYYADYTDVVRGRGGVSLVFGKLKPGSSELRNKVEIVFSEDDLAPAERIP